MWSKVVSILGLCLFPIAPLSAQGRDGGEAPSLVDEQRIEQDRADYTPISERVPNLCLGDGCGGEVINTREVISLGDYPLEAWNEGRTGRVEARIYVGEDRRLLRCAIMVSSGHDDLDRATCQPFESMIQNSPEDARDRPAIADYVDFAFDWERTQPFFTDTITITTQSVVGEDDEVKSCELLDMAGPIPDGMRVRFENEPCPANITRNRAPYRDAQGRPVEKRVTTTIEVRVEDVEPE